MKNDLVQKILTKKLHCVFISPHFDDAILSCGTLIAELSGKVDITIVNVFTKAHKKPYTLSARKFLMDSGYSDAQELYKKRREEDQKAFSSLAVNIINVGLEDALFRRKEKKTILGKYIAEFNHVYPTYQFHIARTIASDDQTIVRLEKQIEKFNNNKYLVFAPFGIGNHADHRIARLASEKILNRYILYSDFPYNVRLRTYGSAFKNGEEFHLDTNIDVKTPLIKAYKTQFTGLFINGIIPAHQEIYFSNQKL